MVRTILSGFAALSLLAAAGAVSAQETVYTLTPPSNYVSFNNNGATPCSFAPCTTYAATDQISGTFTTIAPLAANLTNVNVLASVKDFHFSSGVKDFASTDPRVRVFTFDVSTNARGEVFTFTFTLDRFRTAVPVANSDPNGRFDRLLIGKSSNFFAQSDIRCQVFGVSPAGVSNSCIQGVTSDDYTTGGALRTSELVRIAAATVPTMSEWAMILMGLMLAGGAALFIQRRQMTA